MMGTDTQEPAAVSVFRAALTKAVEGDRLRALARETGVSPNVISRFVRGERGITLAMAAKLFGALGLALVPTKKATGKKKVKG